MARVAIDFERDFIEDCADTYGRFPPKLAALARGVPRTVWKGDQPQPFARVEEARHAS